MRYVITAAFAAGITALLLVLNGESHALPIHGKWSALTLQQQQHYVKRNLAHARGAIQWARTHRHLYASRGLAGSVVASHRKIVRKATRTLHWIRGRLYALTCRQGTCIVQLIRRIFTEDPGGAVTVAWCESNWTTFNITGQYVGVFQLGISERAAYGDVGSGIYASSSGSTAITAPAWEQIVAAHRLYRRSGWYPWQCLPGGGLRW